MALVLDTSVLLGALDAADADHEPCAALISGAREELIVPALVLSELDYWCHERLAPEVWLTFLADVLEGVYGVAHPTQGDLERCHELQGKYADLELGVVDASVLAVVEHLGEPKLATLDRRHFATVRPRHVDALTLLPA